MSLCQGDYVQGDTAVVKQHFLEVLVSGHALDKLFFVNQVGWFQNDIVSPILKQFLYPWVVKVD